MKKNLFNFVFALLFSFCAIPALAQSEEADIFETPIPKWVPINGYWVVETHRETPKSAILYFYNNNNLLVYKEKMEGVKLNLKKRRTKMQLKRILDASLALYEQRKKAGENEMLAVHIIAGK